MSSPCLSPVILVASGILLKDDSSDSGMLTNDLSRSSLDG
jgi:hypothetical protein